MQELSAVLHHEQHSESLQERRRQTDQAQQQATDPFDPRQVFLPVPE